jgi:hypothetical protein
VVRNQLDKKEESCHELEVEVVNLRKKVEKFRHPKQVLEQLHDPG